MAITTTTNDQVWEKVRTVIKEVLLKRKFQFTEEEILVIIKNRLIENGFDMAIIDCSYLQIIFLNVLEDFVNENILYPMDGIYIPSDYMALNEYETRYAELLYLLSNDNEKSNYINVATLKSEKYVNRRSFLLTGGYSGNVNPKLKTPDVPLREIALLYRNFIEEGASKEEAINHVLNYYHIKKLSKRDNECNILLITKKEKYHHMTKQLKR